MDISVPATFVRSTNFAANALKFWRLSKAHSTLTAESLLSRARIADLTCATFVSGRRKCHRRGTVNDDRRSSPMPPFTYNFTDFVEFTSPSMEMLLAPHELFQFAGVVAQEMLFAVPDLVHKGLCVAIYDVNGTAVSIAPLGTVH
jgi:hypothetical protein